MTQHCLSVGLIATACLASREKSFYRSPPMDLHAEAAYTTGHQIGSDNHCKVCGWGLGLVTVDLCGRIVTSEALVNHKIGQNSQHPSQDISTEVFWWYKLKMTVNETTQRNVLEGRLPTDIYKETQYNKGLSSILCTMPISWMKMAHVLIRSQQACVLSPCGWPEERSCTLPQMPPLNAPLWSLGSPRCMWHLLKAVPTRNASSYSL